jgi:hypothetical protein
METATPMRSDDDAWFTLVTETPLRLQFEVDHDWQA